MSKNITNQPVPGTVYNLTSFITGRVKSLEDCAIKPDSLPLGQRVSYGDMANPRQVAIVVEIEGGAYGQKCIFTEDFHIGQVSMQAIEGLGGWQLEDGIATLEEIEAIQREQPIRQGLREIEEATAAQQKANYTQALIAELKERYPWAKADDNKTSRQARAAANIRKELSLAFPGVKFSVRSESFSGGNSVHISWTLGPTTKDVDAITDKYQYGSFDGMQDLYENDRSAYGNAVEIVLGRAKYVQTAREYSQGVYEQVGRMLCELQHVEYVDMNTQHLMGQNDHEWLSTHVYRILAQTSFGPGETIAGVRQANTEEWKADVHCWAVIEKAGTAKAEVLPRAVDSEAVEGVIVTENEEKNGVEIRFPSKPDASVLESLKANGWRWSRFNSCWYNRRSESTLSFARSLSGVA